MNFSLIFFNRINIAPVTKARKEEAKAAVVEPKVPSKTNTEISEIIFKIFYKTVPGQDLYISGEDEKFGNWGKTNLGIPLKWTPGHIWIGRFSVKSLPQTSNFKFIVQEKDGSITWDEGEDRVFDIKKLQKITNSSHFIENYGDLITEVNPERIICQKSNKIGKKDVLLPLKGAEKIKYGEIISTLVMTYNWNH